MGDPLGQRVYQRYDRSTTPVFQELIGVSLGNAQVSLAALPALADEQQAREPFSTNGRRKPRFRAAHRAT